MEQINAEIGGAPLLAKRRAERARRLGSPANQNHQARTEAAQGEFRFWHRMSMIEIIINTVTSWRSD